MWLLLGGKKKKIPGPCLAKLPERHDDLILKHFIGNLNLIACKTAYNVYAQTFMLREESRG